jgi:hypothetical protein
MCDGETTRRGFLGLAAAGSVVVAGCQTTPEPTESTEPTSEQPVDDAVPSQTTSEPTAEPTTTADADTEPTETAPTTTSTVTGASVPPPNSLRVRDRRVSVSKGEYYTTVDAVLDFENVGDVAFTRLEFRVTVSYDPPDGDSRVVGHGYVEERWDGDEAFTPGTVRTFEPSVRFETDGRADESTDSSRFSVAVEYRRVAYR